MDVDAGTVLGAAVTSYRVPEQKAMRAAAQAAMDSGLLVPGTEVLADAAFAGVATIKFPESLGLVPVVRMPVTHCRPGGSAARGRLIRGQFLAPRARANESACGVPVDVKRARQAEWMRSARYGERQAVERVFSTTRRVFGARVMSTKWANALREVAMKLALHNSLCAG